MRYWIKFSKQGNQKYISHRDMHKAVGRILNRAALPVAYSEGFNPHHKISFSNPLELGIESVAEYLDLELTEPIDTEEIIEKMNASSVEGFEFYQAKEYIKWAPKLMAWIELAKYTIDYDEDDKIKEAMSNILEREELFIERRIRKHIVKVNIRSYIHDVSFNHNKLTIALLTGQRGSLKMSQFADKFYEINGYDLNNYKILKTEMYGLNLSQYVTPFELLHQLKE